MKDRSVIICMVVFILLSGLKYFFPEETSELRQGVLKIINNDSDYAQMASAIGQSLSGGNFGEELKAVFEDEAEESSEQIIPAASGDRENIGDEACAAEDGLVEAFLQKQAELTDKEIPAKVRTDMPDIPFEYVCPVSGIKSSGFGYRLHPIFNELRFHYGTDFAAEDGQEVLAFADGEVYAAGETEGYGNYLIIKHPEGYSTLYAHLSKYHIHEGDKVSRGELVAEVGMGGNATEPHLHFELMLNEKYLNPEYYV